jgi:hypothetical protein
MQIACPYCQKSFEASVQQAGALAQCPHCGQSVTLNAEPVAPAAPRAAAPQKKGMSAGSCIAIGCLSLVGLLIIAGAIVAYNFKDLATKIGRVAAVAMIEEVGMPDEMEKGFITEIDRVVDAYKSDEISTEELGAFFEKLGDSPLIPMTSVLLADIHYLQPSGLSPDEKKRGSLELQRFGRGAVEEKLADKDVEEAVALISRKKSDDQTEFRSTLSDPEVRNLIATVKAKADAAGIPDEPYDVDPVAEFKKLVDQALKVGS